jgi:ElaB/YqjD/DUF883 family membrane-anchored ribosome-binding protein
MTTRNPGSGERGPTPMVPAGSRGAGVSTDQDARRGTAGEPAIGSEATSGAMSAVGTAVEQAKEKTGELVDQATAQAKPELESRKEQVAEGLGSTARALYQTSRQLREQEAAAPVAEYAERAAARVERLADHLRERDLRELIGEVEDFARRQPVLFVGGAFTVGLFAARFLKSSGERGATTDVNRPQAGRRVAPSPTQPGRAREPWASGGPQGAGRLPTTPPPAPSRPAAGQTSQSTPATRLPTATGTGASGSATGGTLGPTAPRPPATPSTATPGAGTGPQPDTGSVGDGGADGERAPRQTSTEERI